MLYVIPTPIGNLSDITLRAIEVLKAVSVVLAEDTRTSKKLLDHYSIPTNLQSFHAHNEHARLSGIIDRLKAGEDLAIITDAGMPGISDPGYLLIRECLREDVEVDVLPGATAFIPGLLHSGFPNHIFQFVGFLPAKKGRKTAIDTICEYPHTTVLYESPYRILKLLEQLNDRQPQRHVSVSRELTKLHQTTVKGPISEVLQKYKSGETIKGEFVVTLAPLDFEG